MKLCMYCQCPSNCVFLFIVLVTCCSQLLLIVLFVVLLLISPSLVVCLSGVVAVELELDVAGLVGELHGDVDCTAPWCDMAGVQPLLCRSTRLQHNKSGHKSGSNNNSTHELLFIFLTAASGWAVSVVRRCEIFLSCFVLIMSMLTHIYVHGYLLMSIRLSASLNQHKHFVCVCLCV